MKMNSWDKNRNLNIYKQKLQSVKSTMHKIFTSPNVQGLPRKKISTNGEPQSIPLQESYQRQQSLKKSLSQFGLQQYLRKFYELGYDDNSLHKLANVSHKDMEEFMMRLKIFPGHRVKVLALLENMRRVYSRNGSEVLPPKKRFHSVNSNRINNCSPVSLTNSGGPKIRTKPKSVETLRTNNRIVKSFAKGNGFGFNYYLDNDDTSGETHNKTNRMNLLSGKSDSQSELRLPKEETGKINEEIDQLLNFYISQLNEKLDDSIDSLDQEDSSLSNLNSIQNILNKKNIIHSPEVVSNNIPITKNDSTNGQNILHSMKLQNLSDIHHYNNESSSTNRKSSLGDKNANFIEKKVIEIEEQFYNDYDDIELEGDEENENKRPKEESALSLNNSENNVEEHIYDIYESKSIKSNKSAIKADECLEESYTKLKEEEEEEESAASYNENNPRLVKSCEEDYLRQHMDAFDVEYMCRCLGLALMKHLESGQEKSHIMDLIDFKENFSFFNSVFNLNIEFFNTFFSMENLERMSNLDKLDAESTDKTANEQPRSEDKPISYVSHMGREPKSEGGESQKKGKDFDQEMKAINDYFNDSKIKNQNAKTLLNRELDCINELDSMDYCSKHELHTVKSSKTQKSRVTNKTTTDNRNNSQIENNQFGYPLNEEANTPSDYLEVLRQSAVDFVGENKSECLNGNQSEEDYSNAEKFNQIKMKGEEMNDEETDEYYEHQQTPLHKAIPENIEEADPLFESGLLESNYIIEVSTAEKLKNFLIKTCLIYDDDYDYTSQRIPSKRFVPPTDPAQIFEFCVNIILMTKMEKEVIMICLIYVERLIFNTGILLNSRNWKRIAFTSLVIASKIWDDDSFENNHFAQVFPHLKIGEINLLERTFLELINYKVYVKCSEYFKYFFIIKSISLKYNFNGVNLTPVPVQEMMKLQEMAYNAQKKLRKKYSLNNSAQF